MSVFNAPFLVVKSPVEFHILLAFFVEIPCLWYANAKDMGLWECGNRRTFAA